MKANPIQNTIRLALSIAVVAGLGAEAIAQAPSIQSFSPTSGPVGTVITITGAHFDHDKNGAAWTGATPPYYVGFAQSGGIATVTPTFISSTQIKATVPPGTVTAPITLRQGFTLICTSSTSFTVTTATATTGKLRVIDYSQYALIDLRLNGTQTMHAWQSAPPGGGYVEVTLTPGGVTIQAGLGFYNADGSRDDWFTLKRSALIVAGQTTTVNITRITIGQLLTLGSTTSTWQGIVFDNNGLPHGISIVFTISGGWEYFVDSQLRGSGTLGVVSWPNNASIVQFSIASNLPAVDIAYPFGSFFMKDPISGQIVEFVKQ